jgi:pantoate--beta-alanine ligase
MQVLTDLATWQSLRETMAPVLSLGFVPTMGNLHAGHASLIKRSVEENDLTVLSVFVNPTQFDDPDDLSRYPQTPHLDCEMAEKLGVDYVLMPDRAQLYRDDYRFEIKEKRDSLLLEGLHRVGHFNGVLTVVMKLLSLVRPARAYFGEKDYQQYRLIKDMAASFFMSVEIIPCAIVREASGLALSSRNQRLSAEGREKAAELSRLLFSRCSVDLMIEKLKSFGIEVDYVADIDGRRFAAVVIESVRLIDNVPLSMVDYS